jgi:hypothetical protein
VMPAWADGRGQREERADNVCLVRARAPGGWGGRLGPGRIRTRSPFVQPASASTQKNPSDGGEDNASRHERQSEEQQRRCLRVGARDARPDKDAVTATKDGCDEQ